MRATRPHLCLSVSTSLLALAGAAHADVPSHALTTISLGPSSTIQVVHSEGVMIGKTSEGVLFRWTSADGAAAIAPIEGALYLYPHHLSAAGEVVGKALDGANDDVAFRADKAMQEIGLGSWFIDRVFINDANLIAAAVTNESTNGEYAFVRSGENWIDIGVDVPGSIYGYAVVVAVNDAGQIAGDADFIRINPDDAHPTSAVFRRNVDGDFTVIAPLGGNWPYAAIFATAMNESGQITGKSSHPGAPTSFQNRVAFRYSDGEGLVNLQTIPAALRSEGQLINDHGNVAGVWEDAAGTAHGFFYSDQRGMLDLGITGNNLRATAINNRDEVLFSNGMFWSPREGAISLQSLVTPDGLDAGELGVTAPVGLMENGSIVVNAAIFFNPYLSDPPVGLLIEPMLRDTDVNADSFVNVADLLDLLAAWGSCGPPVQPCAADFDGDGGVSLFDLLELLRDWG